MSEGVIGDHILNATEGFALLFGDDTAAAEAKFSSQQTAFHRIGRGLTVFLQAALGMEQDILARATTDLYEAEQLAENEKKSAAREKGTGRFSPTAPYDVLVADAVVCQALTQLLTESAFEMAKAVLKLNRAHKLFNNTFNAVFPCGVASLPESPIPSPTISRKPSTSSLASTSSATPSQKQSGSRFGGLTKRFGYLSVLGSGSPEPANVTPLPPPNGPVEELIMSGACFGYGLFGLILSLLPPKIKRLIGIFGFTSDRKAALRALTVSASYSDVHAAFAALTLCTYIGAVLLLSGWNADPEHDLRTYDTILKRVEKRYPNGSLWILNRAKLCRMNLEADKAIDILQVALGPERTVRFPQADTLLVFELAWTLLAETRYREAADAFVKIMELNSWSHATYTLIAAGCLVALPEEEKTPETRQEIRTLLDRVPVLLDQKQIGGRRLPMEQYASRKVAFWMKKQARRAAERKAACLTGDEEKGWEEVIKISPAEECSCFWNSYSRVSGSSARAHIASLSSLTPHPSIPSPFIPAPESKASSDALDDLDTPDELATRDLLLGVLHRAAGDFKTGRKYLEAAVGAKKAVYDDTWAVAFAAYELAVLELWEADADTGHSMEQSIDLNAPARNLAALSDADKATWKAALDRSIKHLDRVANQEFGLHDMEGRQMSRQLMLRDEITAKREQLGL